MEDPEEEEQTTDDEKDDNVLPSCVRWAVRNKYPESTGVYTGYPTAGDLLEKVLKTHRKFEGEIKRYKRYLNIAKPGQGVLCKLCDRQAEITEIIPELSLSDTEKALRQIPKSGVITYTAAFEAYAHDALSQSLDILYRFRDKPLGQIERNDLRSMMTTIRKDESDDDKLCELLAAAFGIKQLGSHKGNPKWDTLLEELRKLCVSKPHDRKLIGLVHRLAPCHKNRLLRDMQSFTVSRIKDAIGKILYEYITSDVKLEEFKSGVEKLFEYWMKGRTWTLEVKNSAGAITTYDVEVSDYRTLEQLSFLFHGIRCIFAHGSASRTLDGGSLSEHNLPGSEQDIHISVVKRPPGVTDQSDQYLLRKYIYDIRNDVRNSTRQLKMVDFYLCENIGTFYEYLVQLTECVCASMVYETVGERLQFTDGKTIAGVELNELVDSVKYFHARIQQIQTVLSSVGYCECGECYPSLTVEEEICCTKIPGKCLSHDDAFKKIFDLSVDEEDVLTERACSPELVVLKADDNAYRRRVMYRRLERSGLFDSTSPSNRTEIQFE